MRDPDSTTDSRGGGGGGLTRSGGGGGTGAVPLDRKPFLSFQLFGTECLFSIINIFNIIYLSYTLNQFLCV